MISRDVTIKKTHDLGLLAEMLQDYETIDERYVEMCDDLTPYDVKIRYPQELYIEEYHVAKALQETENLYEWLMGILENQKKSQNGLPVSL